MVGIQHTNAKGMNGKMAQNNGNVYIMKDAQQGPLELQMGSDSFSRSVPECDHSFGNTSNGGVNGEKVPSSHQHLEEIDPKNDSSNSPSSLKVLAGKVPTGHNEGHTLSLPKLRHEYNIDSSTSENLEHKRENLSPENVLDNIQENHQLHNTQSLPVWMPSVVATTVSEDAEEQTFDNIGKISLGQLKVEVNDIYGMERQLVKAKSMTNMSSPTSTGSLPCTDNTKRREKKNTENANIRNIAEKISDRKKKKIMKKMTRVRDDGTIDFDLGGSERLAEGLFGAQNRQPTDEEYMEDGEDETRQTIPPLRIVMLIVGTRGDVQPFLAIGKKMQEFGHRVRLATHANFKDFVKSAGLEFYPLGGDPKVLAEYMVKNKGFLSSGPKEVRTQRKQIKLIVNSLLAPCIEPDLDTGVSFNAQAIIANPPAYGHVHVAEYLKIPLHIYFTMPWTPTSAFPHPLSRVTKPAGYKLSYQVVDTMIWLGIRSIINDFRKKKLKLRPIPYLSSQGSIADLPTGYLWSPQLVPKPNDWGPLIDVVGFCFLKQANEYKPPESLVNWLKAGPAPIYIGFGSLPLADPKGMTKIIVDALRKTNQRGLINEGWGGMGKMDNPPDFVHLVQDCPHDWLFPQCAAVNAGHYEAGVKITTPINMTLDIAMAGQVHHGGAGTTAAGLLAACPTTVIPFFGDQPFWGGRIHEKGVGPVPIPVKSFSVEKLVDAIKFMLNPEVKTKATELSEKMVNEDGVQGALDAFHRHIKKHIADIMQETTPPSPHKPAKKKFNHFCHSCCSCGKHHTLE